MLPHSTSLCRCRGKSLKDDITSCMSNKYIPVLPKRELRLRQAMSKDELSYDNFKIFMV